MSRGPSAAADRQGPGGGPDYRARAAAAVSVLQRWLTNGLLSGAVKG